MKLEEFQLINENINLEEYIKYREIVKQNMEHPEWLGDFSKEELDDMLINNTKIWMFYKENNFVCSMMMIPSTKKDLDSFGIKYNCTDVIDYGPIFVMPEFIGNKLQFQMLKMLDEYCFSLGYKYAVGTIHPDNIFSINNLIKDDFIKIGQKELKRGLRNIYIKDLV